MAARLVLPSAVAVLSVLLTGCQGGLSSESKKQMNAYMAAENYQEAEAFLDRAKDSDYGQKNMVLFYLDKAAVQHHEGKFKESDKSFDIAERRMDELYTQSITKAGGMLLLNDTTVDYAGEPFERALLNVFRAMNYVLLGQTDEALVESRKIERFLTELGDKLGGKKGVYSDDAFARYLDAMLYADEGKLDDARISLEASRAAYADYAANYGMAEPRFAFPKDKKARGELVFIHYNGIAPRKVSKTFQVAWGEATALVRQSDSEDGSSAAKNALAAGFLGNAVTVAYPGIVQDPYTIASSEVWVDSQPVGSTILMEDVTGIATKTLDARMALIKTRAVARATIKFILAQTAAKAASKACDQMPGGYFAVQACKLGSKAVASGVAAASEFADTRGWASLPAQIRMARVKLPPGRHDVMIEFKNAAGLVVATRWFKDVQIDLKKRTYLATRTAI
jgi:tetratricopeptide (TPR) repeat protein